MSGQGARGPIQFFHLCRQFFRAGHGRAMKDPWLRWSPSLQGRR
jgi:hypothetical protein